MEVGPSASQIEAAAEMLLDAERPLLIGGGGVARSMSAEAFRQIAECLDAPATATQMGLGAISTASANFIGHGGVIGGEAVVRVIRTPCRAASAAASSWLWNEKGPMIRPGQRVIQIDVDPGAIGRLVPVQLGLLGDAAIVLPELLHAIKRRSNPRKTRDWTRAISRPIVPIAHGSRNSPAIAATLCIRRRWPQKSAGCCPAMPLSPMTAATRRSGATTSRLLPSRALVSMSPPWLSSDFGLPYAIALSLSHPQQPVFNITGDGSFGFTLQELDTARRYGTPVITIIHNNAAWE